MRWWVVVLLLLGVIVVPFALWGDKVDRFVDLVLSEHTGWMAGLFMVSALISDTFLPIPSSMIGALAGAMFGIPLAALIIWTGMTLGCALAFVVGHRFGPPVLDRIVGKDARERAGDFIDRQAVVFLMLARVVPVLAEASVLSASALNLGARRFMVITACANIPVAVVYATIGSWAVKTDVFWPAFGAVAVTMLLYLAAVPLIQRKQKNWGT